MAENDKDLERLQQAVAERGIEGLNAQEQALFQQRYGTAYALLSSDPELLRIALRGIRQGWEAADFQRAYQNSNWYRNRTEAQRLTSAFETSDTTQFNAALQQVKDALKASSVRAGGQALDDASATADARELMQSYYNGNINSVLMQVDKFANRKYVGNGAVRFGGEAATRDMEIRNFARQMGYQISDAEIGNYVDRIFAEEETMDNVQAQIRQQAINFYPQFADRIKAGATMEDIASPYRRVLANMLEIEEGSVDIIGDKGNIDPLMSRALFATDDKGNPRPMALWEFEKEIRKDQRWQYTQNAYDEYATVARELMSAFGASV